MQCVSYQKWYVKNTTKLNLVYPIEFSCVDDHNETNKAAIAFLCRDDHRPDDHHLSPRRRHSLAPEAYIAERVGCGSGRI